MIEAKEGATGKTSKANAADESQGTPPPTIRKKGRQGSRKQDAAMLTHVKGSTATKAQRTEKAASDSGGTAQHSTASTNYDLTAYTCTYTHTHTHAHTSMSRLSTKQ